MKDLFVDSFFAVLEMKISCQRTRSSTLVRRRKRVLFPRDKNVKISLFFIGLHCYYPLRGRIERAYLALMASLCLAMISLICATIIS